jgi:hypothetical protein
LGAALFFWSANVATLQAMESPNTEARLQADRPTTDPGNIMIRNILTITAVAFGIASTSAIAADDWYRSTGGVPPQAQEDFYARGTGGTTPNAIGDDFYARGTGGVTPQAQGDDFYARGTGGVAPQAVSDEFYARGTGGVAPQSHAE